MPLPAIPPVDVSWNGARLALENAEHHLVCAGSLSSSGLYGFAISHLVLASEEAVKSFSFLCAAVGLQLPEPDARRILTNHKARHALAVLSQVITDFIDRFVDLKATFGDDEMPTPEAFLSNIPAAFAGWDAYIASTHEPDFRSDMAWWEQANALKQAGMYVDYVAPDRVWRSPATFTEQDYNNSAAPVRRFFGTIDTFVKPFLKTDVETHALLAGWLAPVVEQLNAGKAEEIASVLFGPSAKT